MGQSFSSAGVVDWLRPCANTKNCCLDKTVGSATVRQLHFSKNENGEYSSSFDGQNNGSEIDDDDDDSDWDPNAYGFIGESISNSYETDSLITKWVNFSIDNNEHIDNNNNNNNYNNNGRTMYGDSIAKIKTKAGEAKIHSIVNARDIDTLIMLLETRKYIKYINNSNNINENMIDINCQTLQKKDTALHIAARLNDVSIIKVLLLYNANKNLLNNQGKFAKDLCRQNVKPYFEMSKKQLSEPWIISLMIKQRVMLAEKMGGISNISNYDDDCRPADSTPIATNDNLSNFELKHSESQQSELDCPQLSIDSKGKVYIVGSPR